MSKDEIRSMCCDIYEGGEWEPMVDYILNLQEELKQQKRQIKNIQEEFLKYNWNTTNPEYIYNQIKSLYESIFGGKNGKLD